MRILITSFGPFKGFTENPSSIVINRLKKLVEEFAYHEIEWRILDVSFDNVDKFIKSLINEHFEVIILTGVASNEFQTRIEMVARNVRFGMDIENKFLKKGPIEINGKDQYTNFNLDVIVKTVKKFDKKIRISTDAGTYLCNYLYYSSLKYKGNKSQVLFVHIADFQNNEKAVEAEEQALILKEILINSIKMELAK